MPADILDHVQRLRAERRPFALATVVAAAQPASGTPGARALVLAGGQIEGWVGGHCAQPTVVRIGLQALADGMPRLVVLSPDVSPEADAEAATRSGVVRVPMTCAGQGELHIFIEPFLPKIELAVIGASPVAKTLARIAALLDFEVWACDPEADMDAFPDATRLVQTLEALTPQLTERSFVIVATIGNYDEDAVQAALASPAAYVGVVASQKRGAAIRAALRTRGADDAQLARLQRPKGMPGATVLPAEIALSVLAELVEIRRQVLGRAVAGTPPRAEATDPICGMTVDIATARYTSERDGQRYYFCCAGCQASFEAA
jgi:xanthine dehydrogenase accessory factor